MLYRLGDQVPQLFGPDHYLAPGCAVIGQVHLHDRVSIWFNAVLRGDTDLIVIGEGSNVQDGAVLHTDPGLQLRVGRHVTIGHKAMLHGCNVGDHSLIGINAVILNRAQIGQNCLIGAHSLVTEGQLIPDGSLVMGCPAKVVRPLTAAEIAGIQAPALSYQAKLYAYRDGLQPC